MPCQSDPSEVAQDAMETADRATRVACELVRNLRSFCSSEYNKADHFMSSLSKKTQHWIKKHDAYDKQRRKNEKHEKKRSRLKTKALRKLSKEEREALGL